MEKDATFFTVTDCHCGCREDTKSSVPDGVTCIRSKIACIYLDELGQMYMCTTSIVQYDNKSMDTQYSIKRSSTM